MTTMVRRVAPALAVVFGVWVLGYAQQGAAADEVSVDCAYHHVDVGGQYPWTENAEGLTDFAKSDHRAGLLKVYVHNPGVEAVSIEATALNGTPLEELRTNDKHEVIWWRTWPTPVPADGYAEVTVRLRYPLEGDAVLSLRAGAQTLQATVPKAPPAFRIETIGWGDKGRRVTIVAQQVPLDSEDRPRPARLESVFLDGKDLTDQAWILAPDFFQGICPIIIELPEGLKTGSFHTYKLVAEDGTAVACTLRTLEDFLRLDMYGAGKPEEHVKQGINCTTHFHTQEREALDRYARYGLKSAFHVGTPAPGMIDHPAVYAYLMHDEPDVWDYFAGTNWPVSKRIGYHAPNIVEDTRRCVETDPIKPVMLTLNLTFKPANYYVYSQIPDIAQPDCYPLTIGQPLAWIREVTEACRQSAGPRRVEILPQVNWEDRKDMKYPRPPFPREVWIQYLYGLGAGARGFSGYEHYTEGNHHGAENYPSVMDAVGQTFRRFQLVAPLILQAHPGGGTAACAENKVWVRTLVCGADALLLVAVNDDYESLPADFVIREKHNVELHLPTIPWLRPAQALRVIDGSFSELPLDQAPAGHRITLPKLDTGEVILVCGDEGLPDRLLSRYREVQREAGLTILRVNRQDSHDSGVAETLPKFLLGRYEEYRVSASAQLGHGMAIEGLWNPVGEEHNAIAWWGDIKPRGGEWKVDVTEELAGVEHTVYFQREKWWGPGYMRLEVMDAQGNTVMEKDRPTWDGPVPNFRTTFPTAGTNTIRILHISDHQPIGRVTRQIYVIPATAPPVPTSVWQ